MDTEKFIIMTSQWVWWHLKSPASRLFTQLFIPVQIKENKKAPRHWPLCGEFTGDWWIPTQRASNAENLSILMTSSCQRPISLTNFITIWIWWKFSFALIQIPIQWLLQNFSHGTTAVMSWHVQNYIAILFPVIE